jgi:hypothetical protein
MPSHVRIFWWLSVAAVAYSALSLAWTIIFPSARAIATLGRLSLQEREQIGLTLGGIAVAGTVLWSGITLLLAWIAPFRRQNLARWAFVIVFAIRAVIPFTVALALQLPTSQAVAVVFVLRTLVPLA